MEDAKIVQLYWDRNQEAIAATASQYSGYCSTIAHNILSDPQDVEECVNDTWLGAWNSMPPHRPQILAIFLGKITRSIALDRYRYNTAEKRSSNMTVALEELSDCVSGEESVEGIVDRKELVLAINDFLDTLPSHKRGIFICRYWYFDSIVEISERFSLRQNHVSVILNRLRKQLRMYLLERGYAL